jgi:ligand-binding sensor domain-containing protein
MRNGQIRALAVDKGNKMWVGYAKNPAAGLSTFQVPDTIGRDIALSDVPNTSIIDCFGIQIYGDSVWVLAADGLRRFDRGDRHEITRFDLAGPPAPLGAVHPLAVAPDGSVFVGTTAGVRWHRRGIPPVDFTPDNSPLANIEVRALFVEPSGVLWVGTPAGVNRFDPHYVPPRLPCCRRST